MVVHSIRQLLLYILRACAKSNIELCHNTEQSNIDEPIHVTEALEMENMAQLKSERMAIVNLEFEAEIERVALILFI